jgi:hypothetical protein
LKEKNRCKRRKIKERYIKQKRKNESQKITRDVSKGDRERKMCQTGEEERNWNKRCWPSPKSSTITIQGRIE